MFSDRVNYEKPVEKKLSQHVTVGIYFPTDKSLDAIIEIKNSKAGQEIALYSRTLVCISNSFIEEVLSSNKRFFFNKVKERKLYKRKKKKK